MVVDLRRAGRGPKDWIEEEQLERNEILCVKLLLHTVVYEELVALGFRAPARRVWVVVSTLKVSCYCFKVGDIGICWWFSVGW